jgi:hypothetical protein
MLQIGDRLRYKGGRLVYTVLKVEPAPNGFWSVWLTCEDRGFWVSLLNGELSPHGALALVSPDVVQ